MDVSYAIQIQLLRTEKSGFPVHYCIIRSDNRARTCVLPVQEPGALPLS